MATPITSDYELLTEHFSYPPVSLLDDIINTVNVLADRALDSVERLLLSIPPQKLGFAPPKSRKTTKNAPPSEAADVAADEAARLEIETGTHQLETLLNASIDKTFDVFELYVMHNILNIRAQDQPFMRLSHYAGLDFSAAQQEDRPTPESITALRRRLQASQRLNAALEADKARNEALLRGLRRLVGVDTADEGGRPGENNASSLAFLRNRGGLEGGGGDQPITTTTEFSLSQLQALRSLSDSLRTLLPELRAEAVDPRDDDGGAKSWRRERAEYIEKSSRKYLETVGSLELSPDGQVRDGDWQGQGRGLSKAEVEGLEKVVALLGETKQGDASPLVPTTGDASGEGEAMSQL